MSDATNTIVTAVPVSSIQRITRESGLAVDGIQTIVEAFGPIFVEAQQLAEQAAEIQVPDATHVTEIKAAGAMRRSLAKVRSLGEKTRKTLKEDSLKRGQVIDKINRALLEIIEPQEERLTELENIAERQEAERKEALKAKRVKELGEFIDTAYLDLANMPEADYANLLESSKQRQKANQEATRKAEADRAEREAAEKQERERIAAENTKLRLEAEQRELAAKAERDKAIREQQAANEKARLEREAVEAKARKEREELEAKARQEQARAAEALRIEQEARQRAEAARIALEQKDAAERAAQARREQEAKDEAARADRAPDKEKLQSLAVSLYRFDMPAMASPEGKKAMKIINADLSALMEKISDMADKF